MVNLRVAVMSLVISLVALGNVVAPRWASAQPPDNVPGPLIVDEWSARMYVLRYPGKIDDPLAIPLPVYRVSTAGVPSALGILVIDETCPPQKVRMFSSASVVYSVVMCENAFRDVARLYAAGSGEDFTFLAELDYYSWSYFLPSSTGGIMVVHSLHRRGPDLKSRMTPWTFTTYDRHGLLRSDTVRVPEDSVIAAEYGFIDANAITQLPNGDLLELEVVGEPGLDFHVVDTAQWITYCVFSPRTGRIVQRGTKRIIEAAHTVVPLSDEDQLLGAFSLGRTHDQSWFLVGGRGSHADELSHGVVGLVGFSNTGVLIRPTQIKWLDSLVTTEDPDNLIRSVIVYPRSGNWFRVIDVDTALQMTTREAYGK